MTTKEKCIFHKNYKYMWSKLSTTHYYATCENASLRKERTSHLLGCELLPSYTMCSRCMKDEYEPSIKTVNKIVQFYNQNLSPAVSTRQFLNEELELSDNERYRNSTLFDNRFIGTFYGYYLSASLENKIVGAVLKIYEEDGIMKAVMISGIRNEEELTHPALHALIENTPIPQNSFQEYYNSRTTSNQRCYLYEGNVDITNSSLSVSLFGIDIDARRLYITFNIDCFPLGVRRSYHGGLAFALSTSDGPFDARLFQIGFINSTLGSIAYNDTELINLLRINHVGNHISLTSSIDRKWYEFVLANISTPKYD